MKIIVKKTKSNQERIIEVKMFNFIVVKRAVIEVSSADGCVSVIVLHGELGEVLPGRFAPQVLLILISYCHVDDENLYAKTLFCRRLTWSFNNFVSF